MIHPNIRDRLSFIYDTVEEIPYTTYAIVTIGKSSSLIGYDASTIIPIGFYQIIHFIRERWGMIVHTKQSITGEYNGTFYPKAEKFTLAPKGTRVLKGTPYFADTVNGVDGEKYRRVLDINLKPATIAIYKAIRVDIQGNIFGTDPSGDEVKIC